MSCGTEAQSGCTRERLSASCHEKLWRWLLIGLCLLAQSCATPTGDLREFATEQGLERSQVRAGGFNLLVFDNNAKRASQSGNRFGSSDILRVYLEGDGSPWRYNTVIMPDPTPRNPLMLRLMSMELRPAVYLGRPCYNGAASEPGCDSSLWTSGRYSATIVDSMASAIRALVKRYDVDQLWLIGHSGGGALAMLLAEKLPQVTRIVTLAGNLDTDAWTSHHSYTPLYSSMNPATSPELRPEVWQWHLVGGRDSVIPPPLVKPVIMRQVSASGIEVPGFNHGCCWERIWPSVLRALAQDDPYRIPGVNFKSRAGKADSSGSR